MPGRRYADFVELLEPLHAQLCAEAKEKDDEVLGETAWNKLRLIVAHDPVVAKEATAKRDMRIAELQKLAAQWSGKLDEQDTGKKARIQHHQVIVNDTQPVTGLSTINQEHTAILAALTIKKPTLNTQLTLL